MVITHNHSSNKKKDQWSKKIIFAKKMFKLIFHTSTNLLILKFTTDYINNPKLTQLQPFLNEII